jgi:choline dehydrogenase-like flavoprotein
MSLQASAFDFVVVGGGTAGCALAARLSEDKAVTVCLIEAGGSDQHPFVSIPAAVQAAVGTRRLNWGFTTTPQPELDGRKIPLPRGRVLGGSGSINGMVYHRGHPLDYEDWAQQGASGWSYAEVLPYFTRSEHNEDHPASWYHGRGGPLNVSTPRRPNPMTRDFIAAVRGLGFAACADFVGPEPEGVGMRQATIRNGRRDSTARSFLRPALSRGNLAVLTDSAARRILFEGKRATGVEYLREGEARRVRANREVILTAGAIQSPQLLLCSGVGDGGELATLGIPLVHHLPPVGRNLHDHLAAPVRMDMLNGASYGLSWRALPRGIWNVLEYVVARTGPLAGNVFEAAAFLRTDPRADRPDLQLVFQPWKPPTTRLPLPIGHGFGVSPVILHPKSRGRLSIRSSDALEPPLVDSGLLSHPDDLPVLIRAVRLCRQILSAAPFERYRGVEAAPGAKLQSDPDIAAFIRATAYTVHHPVGTCRMGSGPTAVVDPTLKVRGIDGLRVADASVFPSIVGGNTNAPVIMVAEKAADLILGKPPLEAARVPDPLTSEPGLRPAAASC